MLNFFFGWITKPAYMKTTLDEIAPIIEFAILFIIIMIIASVVGEIKNKKRRKK